METYLRTYQQSGTVFSIVSLLAQAAASPKWRLYKKQPVDGRRRYSTSDEGDDQRTEVVSHAALTLWNRPNSFHSGFEFREGANQHEELTGETIWVLNREGVSFPTSMWYIRPDRMEPVPSPDDYLQGWIYTGPNGEQIPLELDEVIVEKLPDPIDPFRGAGPVGAIVPNIQQQRYATDYQRNLFLNGADPGAIIQVDKRVTDREWQEFGDRWREGHQGVARAGRIAMLENGMTWVSAASATNKDMEYGNLRQANRDELREAWRMHKSMLGTVEDVNRANAQTAEEVFVAWSEIPRLDRRKETLNTKLLPMFYPVNGMVPVEFDYDDPSPVNQEAAINELLVKAQCVTALVDAGYDQHDVLEVVGLPDMDLAESATQQPALPPGWVAPPAPPAAPAPTSDEPAGRETVNLVRDATRKRVPVPPLQPAKRWVADGPDPCAACAANADDGAIPVGEAFESGALEPPQHPHCECRLANTVMKHGHDLTMLLRRVMSDGYVPIELGRR
jgi:HK97 family phage portal protein